MAQRLGCYLGRRVAAVMATKGEQWWQATLEVEFGGIVRASFHVLELGATPHPTCSCPCARAGVARWRGRGGRTERC